MDIFDITLWVENLNINTKEKKQFFFKNDKNEKIFNINLIKSI